MGRFLPGRKTASGRKYLRKGFGFSPSHARRKKKAESAKPQNRLTQVS
jgi:hypothetical protein